MKKIIIMADVKDVNRFMNFLNDAITDYFDEVENDDDDFDTVFDDGFNDDDFDDDFDDDDEEDDFDEDDEEDEDEFCCHCGCGCDREVGTSSRRKRQMTGLEALIKILENYKEMLDNDEVDF